MNLLKVRTGMLTTLLVGLGVLGLAGCGGDTPTATPVAAPTATTAAVAAPTATEATVDEPTAVVEEPTATEGTMEEPTATAGAGTGDSAANDLLSKSGKAMADLKTFHMTMKIESSVPTGNATAEIDVSKPDSFRYMLDSNGANTEILIIGTSSYTKIPGSDQYFESTADPSMLNSLNTTNFADVAQGAEVIGDETIDGVATTHLSYTFDPSSTTGVTGGQAMGVSKSDLWIDKSTGYVRQAKSVTEAGGVTTTSTITYSKFDEPIDPPIEKPTNIMIMPEIPTVAVP